MPDPNEFRFLPAQLAELQLPGPVPAVRREQLRGDISALVWGDEPAAVVFLHGAALNAHTWDDTLLLLGASRTVTGAGFLALDLPGHGDSAWRPDGVYAPELMAPDVLDALTDAQARGLLAPRFAIVGHSLGGLIGLELTRLTPDFDRLVLVEIVPLQLQAASALAEFLNGPSSFTSREEIVERALAFGLGGSRASLERAVEQNTRLDDGTAVWKHHLGQLGAAGLRLPDPQQGWELVEQASLPISLIVATNSIVDEASLTHFRQLRPEAGVQRIKGGHNLQEDAPAELAAQLADILG